MAVRTVVEPVFEPQIPAEIRVPATKVVALGACYQHKPVTGKLRPAVSEDFLGPELQDTRQYLVGLEQGIAASGFTVEPLAVAKSCDAVLVGEGRIVLLVVFTKTRFLLNPDRVTAAVFLGTTEVPLEKGHRIRGVAAVGPRTAAERSLETVTNALRTAKPG
jgi:hypothetical protein